MERTYRPSGLGHMDPYDRILQHGSLKARIQGIQLNKVAKTKLEDIFESGGPLCFGYGDVETTHVKNGVVEPHPIIVKTVYVSGVREGNEYVTYLFKPGVNDWVETEVNIHQPTAIVGVLYQEFRRLTVENQTLKSERSTLQLELSLVRHELERVRPAEKVLKPMKISSIIFYGLLIGLIFAHITTAFRTGVCLDSDVSETLKPQTCINWKWDGGIDPDDTVPYYDRLIAWYSGVSQQIKSIYNDQLFNWLLYISTLTYTWTAVALAIGTYYMIRAENPIYMLITLIMATISKMQLFAVSAIPNMEMTSMFSLWCCMALYVLNQAAAMAASLMIAMLCSVICLFMGDAEYIQVIRGHGVVIITIVLSHVFHVLQIPNWVTVLVIVALRVIRLMSAVIGEKIEIRNIDGKVVNVIPTTTSWLNRVSGFVQSRFRQKVRTGIVSTARVIPNGVVVVESKETSGTGFRVQNYIVTAAHVVGNETQLKVKWGDVVVYSKVVYIHPNKDVAYITLPAEFQALPTYKFAKTVEDGTIVITSLEDCGVLAVAVSEGVVVKDNMTYAIQTKNGMSGSPVTNVDGRIIGVHQSNTGFTGGAVIIRPEDLPPQKKPQRELELEAKIKELEETLKSQMNQGLNENQIVDLIRLAVGRELEILRHEMNLNQAKGKNKHRGKHGARRRRKVRVWTEEEYKDLLEKGFSRQQLRDMADVLREAEYTDDDSEDFAEEEGYPQWSDPEDYEEIEREWFGPKKKILDEVEDGWSKTDFWEQCQKIWKETEPMPEESVNTLPSHLHDKYGLTCYVVTKADMQALAKDLQEYQQKVEDKIKTNVVRGQWVSGIDPKVVITELDELWLKLNHLMWSHGLVPFIQRKKINRRKQQKNLKGAPKSGPQNQTN
ncbi:ORF1a [Astrovirus VA3]|uniref:ORF1a n=1 Tax=Astrovirus VA3 TaxID=683174 RepID=UPI000292D74C|nr:ORF1a [Astrovirus VA3]AFV53436.1 ORF1a [Astrovirus VA3]